MKRILPVILLMVAVACQDGRAQITVRGRLALDIDATPGQSISGSIIVDNDTDEPQQAKVYQTDYRFFADGTNEYGTPGGIDRSNAMWIQFSPSTMTIPPKGSVSIAYTITVPDSLNGNPPTGSYWSMMMIEGISSRSAESTLGDSSNSGNAVGFNQVTRYGVQLAVHLRAGAEADVSFDGVELLAKEDGGTVFKADVTNTGTVMIRPNVYMRVFDSDGNEYGPFDGTRFRMYPGTSVRQNIKLDNLSAGEYQALLVVDAGEEAVFGGQFQINL